MTGKKKRVIGIWATWEVVFNMAIIYKIQNKQNGKVYIGQTKVSLDWRLENNFCGHFKRALIENSHCKIHNALRKYGKEAFTYEVIEERNNDSFSDRTELKNWLNNREIYWVQYYKSYLSEFGYNMTKGGNMYLAASNDFKQKISISVKNYCKLHPEEVARISKDKIRNSKISKSKTLAWSSLSHEQYTNLCFKISNGTKQAMQKPEVREQMLKNHSLAMEKRRGIRHSQEHNCKISNSTKSAMQRPEVREKQLAGIRLRQTVMKAQKELDDRLNFLLLKEA